MFTIQPRQSIHTRFLPQTETKPSRVKAVIGSGAKSVIESWDDSLSTEENHEWAALYLCKVMGWDDQSQWVGTLNESGKGYTFVNVVGEKQCKT